MYRNFIKNLFDLIFGILLIILFFPVMFYIFFYLIIKIRSPIFYQTRPGLNHQLFTLYKFKTILDKKCKHKYKKDENFKFGNFLRRTGLDELPQLINVIKGDLSLVGPRPLLIKYLKIKAFKNHKRSKCKPGITGLAQVEVYNAKISKRKSKWEMQFALDKYYYENLSFSLDIKILFMTLFKLVTFLKNDYHNESRLLSKYIK